jgi:membrane protein implicated in regulation of membrane protease activity
VGRVFTLTNAIVNGRGKIKVDDSFWTVTGKDCPAGSKVKVVGAKGLKLEVKVVDS